MATAILEGAPAPHFAPPERLRLQQKSLSRNLDLFAKNGENGGTGQIPLILATTVKPALEIGEVGKFNKSQELPR